jgi:hypothetical protein
MESFLQKLSFALVALGALFVPIRVSNAFAHVSHHHHGTAGNSFSRSRVMLASCWKNGIDMDSCVDELLKQVQMEDPSRGIILECMANLSSSAEGIGREKNKTSSTRSNPVQQTSIFEPILGYYNVSYTLTTREKDNPVGGKWTRMQQLWKVQRVLQHVLPPTAPPDNSPSSSSVVAQIINAIQLKCLWGLIDVWVLLRGDAVPFIEENNNISQGDDSKVSTTTPYLPNLSERTVKVYFDKPRIGFRLSKVNNRNRKAFFQRVLSLGPTSSVVLDTPFVDKRIRLGKGGVSGSQFVFARVDEDDVEAKQGWKWVLLEENAGKALNKKQLMLRVGVWVVISVLGYTFLEQRFAKWIAAVSSTASAASFLWLGLSTGGIETRGETDVRGA